MFVYQGRAYTNRWTVSSVIDVPLPLISQRLFILVGWLFTTFNVGWKLYKYNVQLCLQSSNAHEYCLCRYFDREIYIYIHIHIHIHIYIYCHAQKARKVNRRYFNGILQCFIFLGISVYYIYIYTSSHLPVVCCGTNNRCLTRPGPSVKTPDLKVSGLRACNRFTNTFNTPPKSNMEPLCMAIKCKKCISIHIYYIYI